MRLHLEKWGYTVTEIHGGMNPHERKRAQEDFRTAKQICVATEAAGEGINLQFCRLVYKDPKEIALKSADVILVCKRTGRVLYEGSAGDEG